MRPPLVTAIQTLYLFAPLVLSAALAGAVQRYDWFPSLRRPIDGGATLRGKRVFGDSKTWRGVAIAVAGCMIGAALQKHVPATWSGPLELVDYRGLDPFAFGAAMGGGAMLGELPNSFVKRQLGIAPGESATGWKSLVFYIWDQVDVLTLAWPSIAWWMPPEPRLVAMSFGLAMTLHPIFSLIGWLIGARKSAR